MSDDLSESKANNEEAKAILHFMQVAGSIVVIGVLYFALSPRP
jgi:hypothetical protein